MGNHQRLHGQGVFFHQVRDARIGVDDDLVGQAHLAAAIATLGGDELLAKRPVPVIDRHPDRSVCVHHLLGGDDLELVGIGIEPKLACGAGDGVVIFRDQLEGPL